MARTFRFVHLSDIHFGQEGGGPYGPHDNVRKEILRDCRDLRSSLGKADGILVSGDQAFSGKREQYDRAAAWIEEMADVAGCDGQLAVRVIPGNHDVDRAKINYFCNLAHERLRTIGPEILDKELTQMAKSPEEENPLLPKLAEYRAFASRYGCDFHPADKLSWRKPYKLDDNHRFEIVGLTSVLVCDANDAKDKMILGSNQYILDREDDVEYVVMVHHPLWWFKDQQDAGRYLDRARVILTGHEHMPRVSKEVTDGGDEYLHVAAGATNPPETAGPYAHRYNWLEFSLRVEGERQHLRVKIHPRTGSTARRCSCPDKNRLRGQESASFDLLCPHFKKPLAP